MASVSLPSDVAHRVSILCNAGYAPAAAKELATTQVGAFGAALLEAGYPRQAAVEIVLSAPIEHVRAGAEGTRSYADMYALCKIAGLPAMAMNFYRSGTTRAEAQSILCRALADASDALVTDSQPALENIRHGHPEATPKAIWRRRKGLQ